MNDQNTIGWSRARLGHVTASRFIDVIAGPNSSAYLSYVRQIRNEISMLLLMDTGVNVPLETDFYSAAIAWGNKHEPMARAEYEWMNDCTVIVPPFMVHQELDYVGASPDGISNKGGLEIKAPFNQSNHAETLIHGMPEKHMPQVQGQMWVAGLEYVDFVSFDPRRTDSGRYYQQRVDRSDRYIAALEKAIKEFWLFVMSGEEIPKTDGSVPTLF